MHKAVTVGCFLEYEGKFVMLQRQSHKSQGNTWGLPAGKVDAGESFESAVLREIYEETGYQAKLEELELLGAWEFMHDKMYLFPAFKIRLKNFVTIKINPAEHKDFRWCTPEECFARPDLISGMHQLLQLVGYIPYEKLD